MSESMDRVVRAGALTGVRRRHDDRWVAGVASALGARFGVDPVLFRVGFVLLTLFSGIGLPIYLLCWLMLPTDDDEILLEQALRHGAGGAITLLVFTVISVVGALAPLGEGSGGSVVGLICVGLLIWYLVRRSTTDAPMSATSSATSSATESTGTHEQIAGGRGPFTTTSGNTGGATSATASGASGASSALTHPGAPSAYTPPPLDPRPQPAPAPIDLHDTPPAPVEPDSPPERRRDRGVSLLITALGSGAALIAFATTSALTGNVILAWAGALATFGATLVAAGLCGRRAPLVTVAAWMIGLSLFVNVANPVTPGGGVGDQVWKPLSASEVRRAYEHGAGNATLDLSAVAPDALPPTIGVDAGAGDLTIIVPPTVLTQIDAEIGAGDITLRANGDETALASGLGRSQSLTLLEGARGSGDPDLTLTVELGAGKLVIVADSPAESPTDSPALSPNGASR